MIELLTDAMLQCPDSPGFLIDGFPRKLSQGVQFEEEVSVNPRSSFSSLVWQHFLCTGYYNWVSPKQQRKLQSTHCRVKTIQIVVACGRFDDRVPLLLQSSRAVCPLTCRVTPSP